MRQRTPLTARYAAVQGTFWMEYCVCISFAAVYLQGLGYSNARLGVVMAVGNLLGAVLGPFLSDRVDRSETLTAWRLIFPWLALQAAALLVLALCPVRGVVTSVSFVLFIAFSISLNSLNLKLFVDCVHSGHACDYGVARGTGSGCFVVMSVALGAVVSRLGVRVLPWAGLVMVLAQAAAHLALRRGYVPAERKAEAFTARGRSMAAFLRGETRFVILLLGTALVYFGHNTSTNFLINVTRHAGGDTGTMGALNGFMAAVEIPVMVFFGRLRGSRKSADLMRFSFLFFALKAAVMPLAGSIPLLFAVLLLQAPSFALYTAVIVDYVAETVPFADSGKAQSLAFSMTTLGAVLASLVAGKLYDVLSVPATLWIACGVTAAGVALALLGTQDKA